MSAKILNFDRNVPAATTKTGAAPKGKRKGSVSRKAKPMTEQERAAFDRLMHAAGTGTNDMRRLRRQFPDGSAEEACISMAEDVLLRLFSLAHERLNPK